MSQTPTQTEKQIIRRQLLTCKHGLTDNCWWCGQDVKRGDASITERVAALEQTADALRDVVKLILTQILGLPSARGAGGIVTVDSSAVAGNLITKGLDSAKPADGGGLAFYFATDVDKIYQFRDSSWVDISFSRPTGSDKEITDISVPSSTDGIDITYNP